MFYPNAVLQVASKFNPFQSSIQMQAVVSRIFSQLTFVYHMVFFKHRKLGMNLDGSSVSSAYIGGRATGGAVGHGAWCTCTFAHCRMFRPPCLLHGQAQPHLEVFVQQLSP